MTKLIPIEKKSVVLINKLGLRRQFIDWNGFVYNYKRITCNNDKIDITLTENSITLEYNDYTGFKWEFNKRDTFYKCMQSHGIYKTIYTKGKITFLIDKKIICTRNKYTIKVKKFTPKEKYLTKLKYDTFSRVGKWTDKAINHMFGDNIDTDVRGIVFETILNIVQHNYREHVEVSVDELLRCKKNKIG